MASQIQKENGGGEHAGSHEAFLTVMAYFCRMEMAEESDEQHKIFIEKAEELHEITGGQKQVVIEMLNDRYWKKAIRVAGGNGSLEFAWKVMREFYQTR